MSHVRDGDRVMVTVTVILMVTVSYAGSLGDSRCDETGEQSIDESSLCEGIWTVT